MDEYVVKSGDLNIMVKAENHKLAIMDAIRTGKPNVLGRIIGVLKVGQNDSEEIFMLSEKVLGDMGYEVR